MNTSFLHQVIEYVFTYFSWGYLYFSAGYFCYDEFNKTDVSMRRLHLFRASRLWLPKQDARKRR